MVLNDWISQFFKYFKVILLYFIQKSFTTIIVLIINFSTMCCWVGKVAFTNCLDKSHKYASAFLKILLYFLALSKCILWVLTGFYLFSIQLSALIAGCNFCQYRVQVNKPSYNCNIYEQVSLANNMGINLTKLRHFQNYIY